MNRKAGAVYRYMDYQRQIARYNHDYELASMYFNALCVLELSWIPGFDWTGFRKAQGG